MLKQANDLEEQNYIYIVVNPIISYQAKKSSSLRKVKTDTLDAYRLCELYFKEEFEPFKKRGIHILNLLHLTRQYEVKQYDPEYKRQTVEYILEQRKSVAQVARELDISANTLHGWVKQYKQQTGQDVQARGSQPFDATKKAA